MPGRTVITGISGWWDTRDFWISPVPQSCIAFKLLRQLFHVSTCMEGMVGLTAGWLTLTVCTLGWSGACGGWWLQILYDFNLFYV